MSKRGVQVCVLRLTSRPSFTSDNGSGLGNWMGAGSCHQRLRAIFKDFVPFDKGDFDESHLSGMWSDLETLHSLGILVRHIHPGNYMGGKLIDLSRAWTSKYPCVSTESESRLLKSIEPVYCPSNPQVTSKPRGPLDLLCWLKLERRSVPPLHRPDPTRQLKKAEERRVQALHRYDSKLVHVQWSGDRSAARIGCMGERQ